MTKAKKKTARKKTTKKKVKKKASTKSKKLSTMAVPVRSNHREAVVVHPEDLGRDARVEHLAIESIVKGEVDISRLTDKQQVDYILNEEKKEEERDPYKREMGKYSDRADSLALTLRSQGKGVAEIAQTIGVNEKTIWRWREDHARFSYNYARGRYLYVRGMSERIVSALKDGLSLTAFATQEGIARDEIYSLEASYEVFAKAKKQAQHAAQTYWELLLRDQANGDMYGMVQTELMTHQGQIILDKEGNEIPVRKAHNKPFSDRATLFAMASMFDDYKLNRDQSDNELGSQLDRALQRQRERLKGKS